MTLIQSHCNDNVMDKEIISNLFVYLNLINILPPSGLALKIPLNGVAMGTKLGIL